MPHLDLLVRNSDRVYSLSDGQTLTAGRVAQCDLQLDDPRVSRRHCTMSSSDGILRVKDLESANGTFINEAALHRVVDRGDLDADALPPECAP
jgi:pSer/pThr/pTyr-binding forkhead associated (FHA) protein